MPTEASMEFWRFKTPDLSLASPVDGIYDPFLVFLSVSAACFAGFTALMLADRMMASPWPARLWWHCAGAVAMGCGIWAMHFTGMLAFALPMAMAYDLGLTLLSLVPAILGSGAALYVMARTDLNVLRFQLGALLMALGIGTMHYTGMEAMELEGTLHYDFLYFCLSLVVAHLLAMVALYIRFGLIRFPELSDTGLKFVGGIVMGNAVAGMHYTAMGAAQFYKIPGPHPHGLMFPETAMAYTISGCAALILTLCILTTWVARQKGIQRMLESIAHTDALTGLPNRVLFKQRLELGLNLSARQGTRLALLFLDLDDFKTVNDSLGHAAGDRVLQEMGVRLKQSVREGDTVARIGGDEFVVIGCNLTIPEEAAVLAARLLQITREPIEFENWKLHHTFSIGISIYPDDGEMADELIQHSDAAMYLAKTKSAGYQFFNTALTEQAMERVQLGNDLREALQQEQLVLHYQPWVNLDSGSWQGLEALTRWSHPAHDQISPARFIPIAERNGLILQLGQWALRTACRQGRAWLDAGFDFGRIAINITASELANQELVTQIQNILNETGMPGDRLELEITESSLMDSAPETIQRLEDIRKLGLTLAIDDFGTGYSCLSYLKHLPVNKLKVDQAFIHGLSDDERDQAIIRIITEIGSSLGFNVVAEGIETDKQRKKLLALGCHVGQGYLFAQPASAEATEKAMSAALKSELDN